MEGTSFQVYNYDQSNSISNELALQAIQKKARSKRDIYHFLEQKNS